jgi:hypothetical protein
MDPRKLPLSKIVEDLRTGVGDVPIMERHGITPGELLLIKKKWDSLQKAEEHSFGAAQEIPEKDRRALARHEPLFRITIFDAVDPRVEGIINDIHTKGIQIVGITATVDEVKTLIFPTEPYNVHGTFGLDAECRWSLINGFGFCVAGFRIRSLTPRDARELRKLLNHLTVVSASGGLCFR